jgi:hypothetical protein
MRVQQHRQLELRNSERRNSMVASAQNSETRTWQLRFNFASTHVRLAASNPRLESNQLKLSYAAILVLFTLGRNSLARHRWLFWIVPQYFISPSSIHLSPVPLCPWSHPRLKALWYLLLLELQRSLPVPSDRTPCLIIRVLLLRTIRPDPRFPATVSKHVLNFRTLNR